MEQQRNLDFLNLLYEEKLKHKEHRHEFVKHKMVFTITLFGLGSVNFNDIANAGILLYLVPFVALAFDVYILSEDFKVKRIGLFIRKREKL